MKSNEMHSGNICYDRSMKEEIRNIIEDGNHILMFSAVDNGIGVLVRNKKSPNYCVTNITDGVIRILKEYNVNSRLFEEYMKNGMTPCLGVFCKVDKNELTRILSLILFNDETKLKWYFNSV